MFTFNLTKDLEKSMDYLEEQREKALKKNPKIMKYANNEIKLTYHKHFIWVGGTPQRMEPWIKKTLFVLLPLYLVSFVIFMATQINIAVYVGIASILLVLFLIFIDWVVSLFEKEVVNPMLEYRDFYQKNIILPLLNRIGEDVIYKKDESIIDKHEEITGNLADGEDYVQMKIREAKVEFGEAKTLSKDGSDSNSEEVESRYIICVATFNKELKSQTFLKPYMRLPSDTFSLNTSIPDKFIKLDNKKFNDTFAVHTDDEIEARYILTPTMMEKLLKLMDEFPSMMFLFKNNKIIFNMRIYYGYTDGLRDYDLFDYAIQSNIYDQTQKHYELVSSIANIVKSLELDSKIWK